MSCTVHSMSCTVHSMSCTVHSMSCTVHSMRATYRLRMYVCLLCPQSHLDWKCEDVLRWLKAVHFEPYCDLFARHKVDGEKLDGLTRESLEEMGIADPFHLDNIVECINELCRKDSSRHYSIVSLCRLPFTFTT